MDTETDGVMVRGPKAAHKALYVGIMPLGRPLALIWGPGIPDWVKAQLAGLSLIGHNLRFDLHALDLTPALPWEDTMNMKYFLNTPGEKSLDFIAECLGHPKIHTPDAIKQGQILSLPQSEVADYLADDLLVTSLAYLTYDRPYHAAAPDWEGAFERAVYAMERRGVRLLPGPFEAFGAAVREEEAEAAAEVRAFGYDGSLTSPKQVGEWLVEARGLRLPQTKTGQPSTRTDDLAALVLPETDAIVRFRKANKLRTAFLESFPSFVQDGLIHPSIKTASTVTRRLSCAEPNLQQIPKRTELGGVFRRCFTGPSGSVTVADYSQMEMRVAAALSGDSGLAEIFGSGLDLHDEVARRVGGLGRTAVLGDDLRVQAKALNFGILNGMRPKRLAKEMSKMAGWKRRYSEAEAGAFYDAYLTRFSGLAEWMDLTWAEAKATGGVSTESGARRPFDMLRRPSPESTLSAVSVRVQGTAAEMVRIAVAKAEEAGLDPILQVHDEIVLDGAGKDGILRDIMEEAAQSAFAATSNMTYKVDAHSGPTWGDAK